jgi:hypothetical protein
MQAWFGAVTRRWSFALFAAFSCFAGHGTLNADEWTLEVSAGAHARHNAIVRWAVPSDVKISAPVRLLSEKGREVAVQLEAGAPQTLAWIVPRMEAGAKARYRLQSAAPRPFPTVGMDDIDGKQLQFSLGAKNVIRYNYGVMTPPAGFGPEYARSGYLHPLWSPTGRVISDDFPYNHKHHHGVWMPWTHSYFEGRKVDFWNSGKDEGIIEFVAFESRTTGPIYSGFRARQRFVHKTHPDGPKPVLQEVWDIKVYAVNEYFLIDFVSEQECAGPSPLELKKYRYGGFGFRGSLEWNGVEGVEFLTSEGKTRADGHATQARWCEMNGEILGRPTGIGFLCHPKNFRAPQHMRIHPHEPFFCWAPCQGGDFKIAPGEKYISRYRLVLHDGPTDAASMESLWRDYAEPPRVRHVTDAD